MGQSSRILGAADAVHDAEPARRRRLGRLLGLPLVLALAGLLIAAAAAVAAQVSAPYTTPTAAIGSGDHRAFEIASYRGEFGLSQQAAEDNLATQQRGAALVPQLEAVQGRQYAGVWFDNEAGEFVVPLAPGAPEASVEDSLDAASLDAAEYRTVPVESTLEELEAAHVRVDKALIKLIRGQLAQTSLDPRTNAVVISETEGVSKADEALVASVAEGESVKVEVRRLAVPQLESEAFACNLTERTCDKPLRVGTYMQGKGVGGVGCSVGFKVLGNVFSNRFALSAGHCNHTINYQAPNASMEYSDLGSVEESSYPGGDWMKIKVNGTTKEGYWDEVPWTSPVVYWGGSQNLPIEHEASSFVGEAVCYSGAGTGAGCGSVTGFDVTDNYGDGPIYHLTRTNLNADHGDSGGPVWNGTTALGIVSGGVSGGSVTNFVEVTEADLAMGTHIGTPVGAPPSAQTNETEAAAVLARQAGVGGRVDPNGLPTTYRFEYGPTVGMGSSTESVSAGSGLTAVGATGTIFNLHPATLYFFQLVASNSAGNAYGGIYAFTTRPAAPTMTAEGVAGSPGKGALKGAIDPDGDSTKYHFEWGTTTAYGNTVPIPDAAIGNGTSPVAVEQPISGLKTETTYYYRLAATNGYGTGESKGSFTTPVWRPSPRTGPGFAQGTIGESKITGWIDPNGTESTYRFEWGPTSSYGTKVPVPDGSAGAGTEEVLKEAVLTGLKPEGVYHFRIGGTNSFGTGQGADNTFVGGFKTPIHAISFGSEGSAAGQLKSPTGIAVDSQGNVWVADTGNNRVVEFDENGQFITMFGKQVNKTITEAGVYGELLENQCRAEVKDVCQAGVAGGGANQMTAPKGVAIGPEGLIWVADTGNNRVQGFASNGQAEVKFGSAGAASGQFNEPFGIAVAPDANLWVTDRANKRVEEFTPAGAFIREQHGAGYGGTGNGEFSGPTGIAADSKGNVFVADTGNNRLQELGSNGQFIAVVGSAGAGNGQLSAPVGLAVKPSGILLAAEQGNNRVQYLEASGTYVKQFGTKGGGSGQMSEPRGVAAGNGRAVFVADTANNRIERWQPAEAEAITKPATKVKETEATMNGVVNADGTETKYRFEYGPTTAYGTSTPEVNIGSGTANVQAKKTLTNLEPGLTFHYRIVATNSLGTIAGEDQSFTVGWGLHQSADVDPPVESPLESVACPSGTVCQAVGYEKSNGGAYVPIARSWNGTSWASQAVPRPGGANTWLSGIACSSTTACLAVGSYENAAGVRQTLAESWNGSAWSIKPSPNPEGAKGSRLEAVACANSTTCFAVGSYVNGSGQTVPLVERWNGTEWTLGTMPVPAGATESSLAGVACVGVSACKAVGSYRNGSGVTETLVEHWNGTEWAVAASPNPEGSKGSRLESVSCSGSTFCVAAGWYEKSSGSIVALLEKWNGTQWEVSSSPSLSGKLAGVSCNATNSCFAVGYSSEFNPAKVVSEVWNGTKWEVTYLSGPAAGGASALAGVSCSGFSACTAVGYWGAEPLAERWGSKWTAEYPPTTEAAQRNELHGVSCVDPTSCIAVGRYLRSSANTAMAEIWTGRSWALQYVPLPAGTKNSQFEDVSCTSLSACTAVGTYENGSGTTQPLAERWNGAEWEIQSTPTLEGAVLESVSCTGSICWAVGSYSAAGTRLTLAEKWTGTKWEVQSTPSVAGAKETRFSGVSCFEASACTAVGWYAPASGPITSTAARWNGTSWELQTTPGPAGQTRTILHDVSCPSATMCMAAGFYMDAAGVQLAMGERWNGSKWEVQSTPNPVGAKTSTLYGISCASTTSCIAVGNDYAGEEKGESIYRTVAEAWRGSGWEAQKVPVPDGNPRAELDSVSCSSTITCVAVGNTTRFSTDTLIDNYGGNVTPVVTTDPATSVTATGATLNATVNASSRLTEFYFEYGTTTSYGSTTPVGSAGDESYDVKVNTPVTGLEGKTQYHYRVVATNSAGTVKGEDQVLTTKAKPPVAATEAATGLTQTGATLNGSVNPEGSEASYYFEYGPTTSYGTKTTTTSAGSGTSAVKMSKAVSGLTPGSTYHFRIVATAAEATVTGEDKTFKTEAPTAVPAQLAGMAVTDPFNSTASAVSNFATNWSALGWAGGAVPKGENRTTGWGPSSVDAFPTVDGASYGPALTDTGSGLAAVATMATNPFNAERYFSLWLDMPAPAGSRAGYELRFTDTATNTYKVTLSKWVGGVQTVLASQTGYGFVDGNSLAVVDQGGTVSAWTNTGAGFNLLLSASDSTYSGGSSGVEGSGNITRLTKFKTARLVTPVANMNAALGGLALIDSFAGTENPLSRSGAFLALSWDNSATAHNTGQVATGWGPYDAYPTVNGAYWQKGLFADTGSGNAVSAKLAANPALTSRYFSLWLDMPNPGTAKSGYQLKFLETATGVYEVTLARWSAGTATTLASKVGYSFAVNSSFALVEKAGTISAWVASGGEYAQLLSGADSTFAGGYSGFEGSGNFTRLTEFKGALLAPF